MNDVELPLALVQSDDYCALNNLQKNSLGARLRHFAEVGSRAREVIAAREGLMEIIDEIELDITSFLSSQADVEASVSVYRVHSSWTFERGEVMMSSFVPGEVVAFLNSPCFAIDWPAEMVSAWLMRWGEMIEVELVRFASSQSFHESVAHLMLLDAFAFKFLTFASGVRLGDD